MPETNCRSHPRSGPRWRVISCRMERWGRRGEVSDFWPPTQQPPQFDLLPDNWACPSTCKSPKAFFDPITVEIAGFEDNQAYGFGGNTMSEEGKSNLVFGGLAGSQHARCCCSAATA